MCEEFRAGVDGAGVRHWNIEALAQFDYGADDGFEFNWATGFEILKH